MKSANLQILHHKSHPPPQVPVHVFDDSSSNSEEASRPPPQRVVAPTATYSHHGYARPKDSGYSRQPFSSPAAREGLSMRSPAGKDRSAQRGPRTPSEKLPLTPNASTGAIGPGGRRTCNCKRSNCLKLYCDCFASGEYCSNCNCNCCFNNVENESARTAAIRSILERNPGAFRPKIAPAHQLPLSPAFQEPQSAKHCKVPSSLDYHIVGLRM